MATPEEIRQRVEETDTTRSARRAAAAQQVGELAQRRAEIVAQLAEVERELGDVVADAHDVIDVDELATFTDLKPSDLTGWLAGRKPLRGKRKKPTTASGVEGDVRRTSGPRTSTPERKPDSLEGPAPAGAGASERLVAKAS
jgi:predicted ATP-dependent protease